MSKILYLQGCIRRGDVTGVKSLLKANKDLDINRREGLLSEFLRRAKSMCGRFHWNDEDTVVQYYDIKEVERLNSPLQYLCGHYWNEEIFGVLVAAGADVNWGGTDVCRPPLMLAIRPGNLNAVNSLIEYGADVNTKDHYDNCPLIQAAHHNEVGITRSLLRNGADIHRFGYYGESALQVACENGCVELVRCLLDYLPLTSSEHADTTRQMYHDGFVRALLNNSEEHLRCIEVLIQAGYDLELLQDKRDPFLLAIDEGNIPAVKTMIGANRDVNLVTEYKACTSWHWLSGIGRFSPLEMVLSRPSRETQLVITKLLMEAGCNSEINLSDYTGILSSEISDAIIANHWSMFSLQYLCRFIIRKQMGCVLFKKRVMKLSLPKSVIEFILMKDAIGHTF